MTQKSDSAKIKKPTNREIIIYFIQVESGQIKIGITDSETQLKSRFGNLQSHNHQKLTIKRTLKGTILTEKWLHNKYKNNHIRGEWFEFDVEMLTIIPLSYQELQTLSLVEIRKEELDIIKKQIKKLKIENKERKVIDQNGKEWILNF